MGLNPKKAYLMLIFCQEVSLFPKLNPMRSMHIPKKVMRWQRLFLKVSLKHFYKAWPWEQKFAALTNLEHTLNFSS